MYLPFLLVFSSCYVIKRKERESVRVTWRDKKGREALIQTESVYSRFRDHALAIFSVILSMDYDGVLDTVLFFGQSQKVIKDIKTSLKMNSVLEREPNQTYFEFNTVK